MPRSSPHTLSTSELFLLDIAKRAAEDSPDRSRKVGAVLIGANGLIISVSCNTLPYGVPHEDAYLRRPEKYDWTEHAERNTIYEAAKLGVATKGATIVLPWFPCVNCARAIVQCGIHRVLAQYPDIDDPSWGADFKVGLSMFEKAKIQFDFYDGAPAPQAVAEGEHVSSNHEPDRPSVQELVDTWHQCFGPNKLSFSSSKKPSLK